MILGYKYQAKKLEKSNGIHSPIDLVRERRDSRIATPLMAEAPKYIFYKVRTLR